MNKAVYPVLAVIALSGVLMLARSLESGVDRSICLRCGRTSERRWFRVFGSYESSEPEWRENEASAALGLPPCPANQHLWHTLRSRQWSLTTGTVVRDEPVAPVVEGLLRDARPLARLLALDPKRGELLLRALVGDPSAWSPGTGMMYLPNTQIGDTAQDLVEALSKKEMSRSEYKAWFRENVEGKYIRPVQPADSGN